jgi:hypothetical protein
LLQGKLWVKLWRSSRSSNLKESPTMPAARPPTAGTGSRRLLIALYVTVVFLYWMSLYLRFATYLTALTLMAFGPERLPDVGESLSTLFAGLWYNRKGPS